MKKEETNDIIQLLLPILAAVGIPAAKCKVDTATEASGRKRGDVWISKAAQGATFEANIIALVEAKHRNCELGDMDWRDAMAHGKVKAERQELNSYIVSNCRSTHRIYSRFSDEEITIDRRVATAPPLWTFWKKSSDRLMPTMPMSFTRRSNPSSRCQNQSFGTLCKNWPTFTVRAV